MENALGILIGLMRDLRRADTPEALHFAIVNAPRRLVFYHRALLLLPGPVAGRWRTVAGSGTSQVDRQAPLIQWLERTVGRVVAGDLSRKIHSVELAASDRDEFALGSPLWVPLLSADNRLVGGLWLERPEPWREAEAALLSELADAQAAELRLMSGERGKIIGWAWRWWPAAALAVVGVMFIPVPRAALAPVEIIARDDEPVAAPIDGVIRAFNVRANQRVAAGDILFTLDDTDRQAQLDVAAKSLDIARVEYRQASQGALSGRRDVPRLAVLEAQIALKEIELDDARQQLERTRARAGRDGVALLPDVQDYVGRPVATGERVMQVADPKETEGRAWLAVRDVMPVADGAAVRVFLDADPLKPLDGKVVDINHEGEDVAGNLAYRIKIELGPESRAAAPRVGARGTARIDGDRVPLFLYLFRRPLTAVRQALGF